MPPGAWSALLMGGAWSSGSLCPGVAQRTPDVESTLFVAMLQGGKVLETAWRWRLLPKRDCQQSGTGEDGTTEGETMEAAPVDGGWQNGNCPVNCTRGLFQ